MDFENLFWVIPVIYLLRRVLFGSRKSKNASKPPRQAPRPAPRPALSQKDRNELDELGQALGLPADLFRERGSETVASPAPLPIPSTQPEYGGAQRSATAAEEMMAYDALQETDYETDAWFADEEAFETAENAPFKNLLADNLDHEGGDFDDVKPDVVATAIRSPYKPVGTSGHALRRLAATASLREAVLLKEVLDRPVALRGGPRLPFRG